MMTNSNAAEIAAHLDDAEAELRRALGIKPWQDIVYAPPLLTDADRRAMALLQGPPDVRLVPCETCQTEGRILRADGNDPDPVGHGVCPVCEGTASEIIEVQPIEMEDL